MFVNNKASLWFADDVESPVLNLACILFSFLSFYYSFRLFTNFLNETTFSYVCFCFLLFLSRTRDPVATLISSLIEDSKRSWVIKTSTYVADSPPCIYTFTSKWNGKPTLPCRAIMLSNRHRKDPAKRPTLSCALLLLRVVWQSPDRFIL